MPGPVATIDEAIRDTNVNISLISYDGFTKSLAVQTDLWVGAMFSSSGVFPKGDGTVNTRKVADWAAMNLQAQASIEGSAPGQSTVQSTSQVQNAVIRTLYATKQARIDGAISLAQQNLVITAFNTAWGI